MLRWIALAGLAAITVRAEAQGYFDFGQIPGVAAKPKVQIDLDSALLSFLNAAAGAADPSVGDALTGIENVRVRVYDTTDDESELSAYIDDTSGQLERDGWRRAVYVEDEHSKVRLYMRYEDDKATGLTLMVAGQEHEAVFVNVAGLIDPAQLGRLMNAVGAGHSLPGIGGAAATTPTEAP
jgi:hypothetical protein